MSANFPELRIIVLAKYHTVIFIHGCFWHGHENSKCFVMPKTNSEWWSNKIKRNRQHDTDNRSKLRTLGWRTMVIWECQLKPKTRKETLEGIKLLLEKTYLEIHIKTQ